MGYVFNAKDAKKYEAWCEAQEGRAVERLRRGLITDMVHPRPGERVLDIGCGTGRDLAMFYELGASVTGIEPSCPMLDMAKKRLGSHAGLYRGVGEDLPFGDNAFDVALLITTLEFVDDPQKVLVEACRVAKDRVFVGCMNRFALKGVERRIRGIFTESVYNKARFFSVWELKHLVRKTLGGVPVQWRTCCHFSDAEGGYRGRMEQADWLRRLPIGSFVAMTVTMTSRLRVTPLELKYEPIKVGKLVTGPVRVPSPRRPHAPL